MKCPKTSKKVHVHLLHSVFFLFVSEVKLRCHEKFCSFLA